MKTRIYFCWLACVIVATCFEQAQCGQATPDARDHLGVIAEASLANRESLRPFSMKFRYSKGEARSLRSAEQGRFSKPPAVGDCSLWEDSQRRRFERIGREEIDLAAELEAQGGETVSVPFHSRKILEFHGSFSASYSAGLNSLVVRAESDERIGISGTPFDMGVMGKGEIAHPARRILQKINSGEEVRFDGEVMVDDRLLLRVGLPLSGYQVDVYFDPNRGFLPVRMDYSRSADGSLAFRLLATRIEQVDASFFPTHVRRVSVSPGGENEPCTLEEWVVTDWLIHTPLRDSDFAIDVPDNVRIHNGVNANGVFGLKHGGNVDLAMLKKYSELAAEHNFAKLKAQRRGQNDVREGALGKDFHSMLIVNCTVVGICVLWSLIRFRRRTRRST